MNKKRKYILSISGLAICLALSIFAVMFALDAPYRNKLPEYPDFKTLSKPVQHQISEAGRKAYLNPTVDNLGELGMVYYSSAYNEKAAICYQLADKKSNREWIWSYYLGYVNQKQGESKASIESFRHVLEKNPRNYLALFYTGEAYQNLGLSVNAENIFRRIAASNDLDLYERKSNRENYFPLQTYAGFRLARIYVNSNRLDSAELILKEIIRRQATFGPAYRLLGDVYTKKGDTALSKKFIIRSNDLIAYTPPQDTLIDRIALISRSDKYLLKVIDDAKTSYNFNWALKLCAHSRKYIPEDKFLISNTILIYFILGRDQEALPYLDQHFKYFSDDYDELMKLVDLLYGKGFEAQAMKYFEQAKALQPLNSQLSIWLSLRGKNDAALTLLNDQLKKDPENEKTLTDAAHIYLNMGDMKMVTKYLTILKNRYPSNLEAKKMTGLIYENEGKEKEAMSLYEEISKDRQKDLAIYKYLHSVYIKKKMWDKAILNFTTGLNNFPNDPDLLEGLGRLLITCPDTKLRNIIEGMEYSERAYINFKCHPATKIAAARNIATASAFLGDKQKASWYINVTLNMAIRGKVPTEEYISYFETLKRQYNIPN